MYGGSTATSAPRWMVIMPEPRVNFTLRLSPAGIKEIEDLAKQEQRSKSDMARLVMALGVKAWKQGKR